MNDKNTQPKDETIEERAKRYGLEIRENPISTDPMPFINRTDAGLPEGFGQFIPEGDRENMKIIKHPLNETTIPTTDADKFTFTITLNDGTEIPISDEKVEPCIGRHEVSDKYKVGDEKWTSEIPKDMMKAMASVGVEAEDVEFDFSKVELKKEVVNLISEIVARLYNVIPVDYNGKMLVIAISDLNDLRVQDDLIYILETDIDFVLADKDEITKAIEKYYGVSEVPVIPITEDDLKRKEHILKLLKDAGIDPSILSRGGTFADKDVEVDMMEEIRLAAKLASRGDGVIDTDYDKTFKEIYNIPENPKEPSAISVKSDETDVTIASKLYKDISVDDYFALNPSDRKQAFVELEKQFGEADEKTLEMRKKMKDAGVSCWFADGGMTDEEALAVVQSPEFQKILKENL